MHLASIFTILHVKQCSAAVGLLPNVGLRTLILLLLSSCSLGDKILIVGSSDVHGSLNQ